MSLFRLAKLGCLMLLVAAWMSPTAVAQNTDRERISFFEKRIRPVLVERCYDCHGPDDAEGKLRLDSKSGWTRGGESGPSIVPGEPASSLLYRAIEGKDKQLRMPPEDAGEPLSPSQLRDFARWIRDGAIDPRDGVVATPDRDAKAHWAFQPVRRPDVPKDVHPIDWLIQQQLDDAGYQATPRADSATLVRRAAYDLLGLPPTPDHLKATHQTFPLLIDQMLESPRYGEHWARHWLDVARYSDAKDGVLMYGDARIRPFAYTYRDYVIRAFNDDKPFNAFVREQLAADQLDLDPDSPDLAAMGLLTLGRLFDRNRHDVIDDQIDVVTRAFLGLTVSCARCHDHKFDPVPTTDYYSLYGVFASCVEPLERPRIEAVADQGKSFETKLENKLNEIRKLQRTHYREQLDKARRRTKDYLVEVATTEPDITETTFFFLSLIPDQLRPRITRRWRQEIARRAHDADPIFAPWADLMESPELQVDRWRKVGVDERLIQALVKAKPTTPRAIAEAYGDLLVGLWSRESDLRNELESLPRKRELAQRGYFDLADIVGGGDGAGSGRVGNGVNPADGKPSKGGVGFIKIQKPNQRIDVPTNPYIDGVFTPTGGAIEIATNGLTIEGLPKNQGQTWDYLKNGITQGGENSIIDGVDYSQRPHDLISIHANKGVTFDLAALRDKHGFGNARFTAKAGNGGAAGFVLDMRIYLDGELVFEKRDLEGQGKGVECDLDLPRESRFLTFITLEGGKGISHDQALLGDPRITPTSDDGVWRVTQTNRLKRLAKRERQLEAEIAALPPADNDRLIQLLASEQSPLWFPLEEIEYYLSRQKRDAYRGQLNSLDSIAVKHPNAAGRAMILRDAERLYEPVVFMRGQPSMPGAPVKRRFLQAVAADRRPFANGSGRLDLANAIADKRNPLTARVWVNRVWMHHFGEPLVATPSDFGLRTSRPRYDKLLDFLASEFMRNGWRTKPLHRLIMTSAAWQRGSRLPDAPAFAEQHAADPDNKLLWRMNRRRLSMEQMRDTLLSISGRLDSTMYGRPRVITDASNHRRTVYAFVERQNLPNIVQTFDTASADTSTAKRVMTTVPQQALFAMNSQLMLTSAQSLAERTRELTGEARVQQLFQYALKRDATKKEVELALQLTKEQPWWHFAQALLMSNELMFVD